MLRRAGSFVTLALSALCALVALVLVRQQDLVEFFAGFAAGSVATVQTGFGTAALLLAGASLWLETSPARWTRLARTAIVVILFIAAAATTWRELGSYSRRAAQIAVDGTPRVGTLYVPRGGGDDKHPAVVVVHGSSSMKRSAYHFLARRFAE